MSDEIRSGTEGEDVEGHLLKEAVATGTAAAAMFAGAAQARPVDPIQGDGAAQVQNQVQAQTKKQKKATVRNAIPRPKKAPAPYDQ